MRYFSALAFVVCLAMPAFVEAQTVVINVPESQRQGVFQTPSWDIPANAVGMLTAQAVMSTSEYENTANSLRMRIYWMDLSTGTWKLVNEGTWSGGFKPPLDPEDPPNYPFQIGVNMAAYRGQTIRAEVEVPVRMRLGATVFTTP